jgi:hypothetical protein
MDHLQDDNYRNQVGKLHPRDIEVVGQKRWRMESRGPDIKRCEELLRRCEKSILRALDLLRDIDMKLTHIIECKKNHRYRDDHERI